MTLITKITGMPLLADTSRQDDISHLETVYHVHHQLNSNIVISGSLRHHGSSLSGQPLSGWKVGFQLVQICLDQIFKIYFDQMFEIYLDQIFEIYLDQIFLILLDQIFAIYFDQIFELYLDPIFEIYLD